MTSVMNLHARFAFALPLLAFAVMVFVGHERIVQGDVRGILPTKHCRTGGEGEFAPGIRARHDREGGDGRRFA